MTYTTPWDETQPPGSAQASTLKTIIQNLKRDIRERMNTVVVDWTADPVVSLIASDVFTAANLSVVGSSDATLVTYSMPPTILGNDGRQLKIEAFGSSILGSTFLVDFGSATAGSVTIPSAASPGRAWKLIVDIVRVGPAVQHVVNTAQVMDNAGFGFGGGIFTAADFTQDLTVVVPIKFHATGLVAGSTTNVWGIRITRI